jgi:hypothetical protein
MSAGPQAIAMAMSSPVIHSDPRYTGRDWTALEPEARRGWEAQQKGTWEEFKDTVRYAWEKVRGRH